MSYLVNWSSPSNGNSSSSSSSSECGTTFNCIEGTCFFFLILIKGVSVLNSYWWRHLEVLLSLLVTNACMTSKHFLQYRAPWGDLTLTSFYFAKRSFQNLLEFSLCHQRWTDPQHSMHPKFHLTHNSPLIYLIVSEFSVDYSLPYSSVTITSQKNALKGMSSLCTKNIISHPHLLNLITEIPVGL